MGTYKAYRAWATAAANGQQAGWVFSQENYLGQKTLQMISQMKHQFVELLASIGFVPNQLKAKDLDRAARGKGGADAVVAVTGPAINANNENNRVVSAVLCSALHLGQDCNELNSMTVTFTTRVRVAKQC